MLEVRMVRLAQHFSSQGAHRHKVLVSGEESFDLARSETEGVALPRRRPAERVERVAQDARALRERP